MRVISPILKRVVYPSLGMAGYLRRHSRSLVSVVTYHGVLSPEYQVRDEFLDAALVSIDNFRAQLRLLKSDYDVISCMDFRKWLTHNEALPPRAVLLTCDDGLLNNVSHMLPALREEGLECLFFVTGASAGKEPAMLWHVELYLIFVLSKREVVDVALPDLQVQLPLRNSRTRRLVWLALTEKLSRVSAQARRVFLNETAAQCGLTSDWKLEYFEEPLRNRFALLTKSDLRQLCKAGMTIGAHSMSHPVLKGQDWQYAQNEIADSRKALSDVGGPVWAFAYPFGDEASVGEREFQLAEDAGFECAFVNTEGTLSQSSRRHALPRFHICRDMRLREFEAHITGFHSQLRRQFA